MEAEISNPVVISHHFQPPSLECVYDLDMVDAAILRASQDGWWKPALDKPKLCTYVAFKGMFDPNVLVKSNLKRHNRSLLAKLVSGIMPLEIEIGRYTGTKRELRLCKVCNLNCVEDEYHFLFSCVMYQLERSYFYLKHVPNIGEFMLKLDSEKIAWLLT